MKHIKLFEDFINEAKEKFPDQIEGNDGIIFKKVSQIGDRAKYNQYYRGYDIDAGGHVFGSVAELERFMKDYILSNNLYNKYKHMSEKPISESLEEAISVDASYVHQITGCGQDAAQNFIDDNKIDGKKLADYVKQHRDSKEKYDVRDIIAGTGVGANKSFVKRFIKELK
jgi:hypothetical protein